MTMPPNAGDQQPRAYRSRTDRAGRVGSEPATPRRSSRQIMPAPGDTATRQIGSKPVRMVLAAVSALVLLIGAVGYKAIGQLDGRLAQTGELALGDNQDGATDILLVGIDSRTDAQGNPLSQKEIDMLHAGEEEATNTDTIILIRVPNDGSGATAVSLPRDTYVATPNGNMKLNGVYGTAKFEEEQKIAEHRTEPVDDEQEKSDEEASKQAGRQALIHSVADLTGITVDHYAEIGLLGFVLLTDAVGGVDVCLKEKVNEPLSGANFPKGRSTLKGSQALSFVRQRHGLPRGDLDRITRQQAYMASLVNKVLSSKTLTDPSALNRINDAVERSVVLDQGWDVMSLATQMQDLAGGNVKFQTIPVTSIDGVGDMGESIVTVDVDQVHEFFNELLGEDAPEDGGEKATKDKDKDGPIEDYDAEDYRVNVFNASNIPGVAANVSELTRNYGYKEGEVGNSEETGVSESQVNAKDKNDPAARGLAKQLGGLEIVEDPSLDDKELSVTLAGTYTGPGSVPGTAPLVEPNDPNAGTLTEGMRDLDGDGIPDEGTDSGDSGDTVGQTGSIGGDGNPLENTEDPKAESPVKEIDAGGDGPMCVN
ncbi:LCP family protein [Corynebacterium urealyticum]|uniref:LCP family protein n=1 Tax=Corynebacterium urealyticum TaxID=43771 RepID=UPI0011E802F3|nr:LCP family protein [Corynebacterium urealyticum]TYR15518.1 LytR family transcriptional regulator [Corynebacterium urealyticum]